MSIEKLFGEYYKEDPIIEDRTDLPPEKKKPRRRSLRFPRISKKFILYLLIVFGVFYLMNLGYQSVPRKFPLKIASQKSFGKNDLVSYSLSEKPSFVVKKPTVNPLLSSLVKAVNGSVGDGFTVVLTTPRSNLVTFQVPQSALAGGSSVKPFLIKRTYAAEGASPGPSEIVVKTAGDGVSVGLPDLNVMRGQPRGRYVMDVTWQKDGITYNSVYTFSWGVLVVNTDKDRYEKGDQVRVGAGMVDDRGYTICEGDVTATITDPNGKKATISTPRKDAKNGKLTEEQLSSLAFVTGGDSTYIATSKECGPHSVTDNPDYSFQFSVPKTGTYSIDLSAITEHGTEHVVQKFAVVESNDLIIARTAAMRIYPLSAYTMKVSLLSKNGYTGNVSETVPSEFGISCDTCMVSENDAKKTLTWHVSLSPNNPKTLSYTYNPPDVSPALYTVGPIVTSVRTEERVWAIAFDAVVPQVTLTQRHYIFEDDNAANVNGNSDVAAADTAITDVKRGTRIAARIQADNTSSNAFFNPQFELFYDRSDNIWTRVDASGSAAVTPGTGNCTNTNFDCGVVDNSTQAGQYSRVAIAPDGTPWVSYFDDTNNDLKVANYVGTGGNCGGSGGAWSCSVVDNTMTDGGYGTDIAFTASGSAVVTYVDFEGANVFLRFAQYLGNRGNCTNTAWSCISVDKIAVTIGQNATPGITVDPSGVIWISYSNNSSQLAVAKFVGVGGTGCGAAVVKFTCTAVDSSSVMYYTNIAIDQSGNPWISYQDHTSTFLKVAKFVSSGGNCTSTAWSCSVVDSTNGTLTQMAFDASGNPWVSYRATGVGLKVARYVGGSGNCTDANWDCSLVDTSTVGMGLYSGIAFDPSGIPWISYQDSTNHTTRLAQYVGSGGNCTDTAWNCSTVDGIAVSGGRYTSIAFDPSGNAWISYDDTTSTTLRVARIKRGGEIILGYGRSGLLGDGLTSPAAGSCTGGTSFVTGIWIEGVNPASGSAKLGNLGANKCTELTFMIDTSRAIPGTTYRLRLHNSSPGYDIGMNTYSQNPTFTVVDSSQDTFRASKDVGYDPSTADCTGSTLTGWGCANINANAQFSPKFTSMAMDASGSAWISTFDNWNGDLWVERFVGTNGGGCGAGVTAWKCTKIDLNSTNTQGEMNDIGIDPTGKAWISYYDRANTQLKVAEFVGSGGTGCSGPGVTDWKCYDVDASGGDTGGYTSIGFDEGGSPWISSFGFGNVLRLSRYVGSGGTGCKTLTTWDCYNIDMNSQTGFFGAMKFDQYHVPWIAHFDQSGTNALRIAHYVGTGGGSAGGCGASSSTAWACEIIDDTANTLGHAQLQIAIDTNNAPWVAYYDFTAGDIWVAHYVGSGGTGCTGSTYPGRWSCTKIESTNDVGQNLGIAIGPDNKPWVSYPDVTAGSLRLARYVGGGLGGSSCLGGGTGSSDWLCGIVDKTTSVGTWTTIEFDASGTPWIAETETPSGSATALKIAKLHYPYFDNQLRYSMDDIGYTALASDDNANYDISTATTSAHVPIYRWSKRYSSTSTVPTGIWNGQSTVAASSKNLLLQVYRFGTTNAWETVTTNSSCSANTDCSVSGTPSGTASDYWDTDPDGNGYWIHFRFYQTPGAVETMKTDLADAQIVPTKIVYTTGQRGVTSGVCSGASVPFTIAMQNDTGTTTSPTGTTVVQITSNSSDYTIYSDSSCATPVSAGNFTFTSSDTTKTFYLIDNVRGTHVLTAAKTSGPDTITSGTQFEITLSVNGDADSSTITGGVNFRGGSTMR